MNKKKGLIILLVILIIYELGIAGFIIYNKILLKDDNIVSSAENDNKVENETVDEIDEDESNNIEYETKELTFDFKNESKNNIFDVKLSDDYTENKYIVNLLINNIMVNDKSHYVKITNIEPNDYDCDKGKDKVVSFDDKIIYEPEHEGCYLSVLEKIGILNDKYVYLRFVIEGGGWINIFDENGLELKNDNDIVVYKVDRIENGFIYFVGWNHNDEVIKDNLYKLSIENETIKYEIVKKGTNIIELY